MSLVKAVSQSFRTVGERVTDWKHRIRVAYRAWRLRGYLREINDNALEVRWKSVVDTPEREPRSDVYFHSLREIADAVGRHEHQNDPISILDALSAEGWERDYEDGPYYPVTGYQLFLMNKYKDGDPDE